MHESQLSHLVDPLRETLHNRSFFLERERKEKGMRFAAVSCDIIPGEILAACGVIPLIVTDIGAQDSVQGFDFILSDSDESDFNGSEHHHFRPPAGWADYAAGELRIRIEVLLRNMKLPSLKEIDDSELRRQALLHNGLRRAVRGVHAARKQNPLLLSNVDLFTLYEAAAGLPAEKVLELISALSRAAAHADNPAAGFKLNALVSGGRLSDFSLLDDIEEKGVLAAEDHTCFGRRMFDLSYNPEAPDIVSEIIYAYTFKLYCHSIRKVDEKYELFYKMLKPHGIECAFFIDTPGKHRTDPGDFDMLKKRLMRGGVDPVLCDESNAVESASRYSEMAKVQLGKNSPSVFS